MTPETVDLLLHPDWILTQNAQREVFTKHSLAITDGVITHLLPRHQAQQLNATQTLALPGHALIPGLLNLHGHAAMTLFRGLADDLPLERWLKDHIWPAENALLSPEFVACGTTLAIAEMLRSGTTCYADHYLFPEATLDPIAESGIRAQLFCPIIDVPTNWSATAQEGIARALALHHRVANHAYIDVGLGPHAPYTVSDATLRAVTAAAHEQDWLVQIHLHETQQEVDDSLAQYGLRPIARLHELGVLQPNLQCVHMVALNEEDLRLIQASGAGVVHCPESNLKLASGFAPTAQIVAHQIPMAIGTDGAASNNDLDLFGEMRTAALIAKAVAHDAGALSAQTVFDCATIEGARMLRKEHQLGSLEVGKQADIVALDWRDLELQPIYDPVSQLVYATHREQVQQVWIGGRQVVQDRIPCGIDLASLQQNILHWQEEVKRVTQGTP
jgi:5-methylthioadenosine/S-adenosylhomocysteine deaminase